MKGTKKTVLFILYATISAVCLIWGWLASPVIAGAWASAVYGVFALALISVSVIYLVIKKSKWLKVLRIMLIFPIIACVVYIITAIIQLVYVWAVSLIHIFIGH